MVNRCKSLVLFVPTTYDWFDPKEEPGICYSKFGVVDVNTGRRYNKFEPFILASQADQVSFITYPRVTNTGITWLSAITVVPRGRIYVRDEQPWMQQDICPEILTPDQTTDDILLIDPENRVFEDLPEDTDEGTENDEFDESDDVEDRSEDSDEASEEE
ncbi:hypothetical protein V5N11_007737 [Cardamine amara subsp. amara]|uniref:DUF4216 domain-containing protein n=1 Tax=Cardamine amara subsp. amara TaxID=228776 RepID=A0ABD1C881_CARAN